MRVISSVLCALAISSASATTVEPTHHIRFGGWSHHLEPEYVKNAPRYNEEHNGLGADIGLTTLGKWNLQLSLNVMKDSWDKTMYSTSLTVDRPVLRNMNGWNFAYGLSVGVQSRSIMHDINGEFNGFSRQTLPFAMPYARIGYQRLFTLFTVYPQLKEKIDRASGSKHYRLENPVLFWQFGVAF